jgi:hypothetical protein
MKKFGLALAALCAIIIAAPSMASAQTVVVKRGGGYGHHNGYGARAQIHRDRGYHRGHRGHGNRVVIIKKRRY